MDDSAGPSKDVLAERINNLARTVTRLDGRMDGLATEATLISLINGRDAVFAEQINALREDVQQLASLLEKERAERIAADKQNEERVNRSRTLAISAMGVALMFLFGIVGLITQVGGVAP